MRQRFHLFILALALSWVAACSKPKTPETPQPESTPPAEVVPGSENVPVPAETPAPVTPPPVVSPETVEMPVEKPAEKPVETPEAAPAGVPFWERLRSSTEHTPPPVPKEEVLHVFYQKDPLPESWLMNWTAASHVKVVQSKFPPTGALPVDGDLYLFTPEMYPQIIAGPGALALEKGWACSGLDPVFTSQPFDPHNLHTRPFRWTPYLLYGLVSRKESWKERPLPDLWMDAKALWPNQVGLLAGLTLKNNRQSANPRNTETWITLYRSLENRLHDKMADEAECWRRLQAGEIELTLLPATYRLMLPTDTPATLDWVLPANGTLVYFEQIAVGAHTKKKEAALALAEYLLKFDRQKRLLTETGYFSVRTRPGTEPELTVLKLGKKDWFGLSEFLVNAPVLPKEELAPAVPVVPGTEKEPAKTDPAPTP